MLDRILRRLRWEVATGPLRQQVVDAFHLLWYYEPGTWRGSTWFGYPIQQNPLDLQLYQELVASVRPRRIVQTGINQGGSLLFFAHLLDALGEPDALVIGVDLEFTERARELKHPRIRTVEGDSAAPDTVARVRELVAGAGPVLISLDSDHSAAHVRRELAAYADLVTPDSYLVVEDTNVNGRPVLPGFGAGPLEAADEFLLMDPRFERDELWRRNLISHHAGGWLRRVR